MKMYNMKNEVVDYLLCVFITNFEILCYCNSLGILCIYSSSKPVNPVSLGLVGNGYCLGIGS